MSAPEKASIVLYKYVGIAIVIAAITIGFVFVMKSGVDGARSVIADLTKALGGEPRIIVGSETILEPSHEILELSTAERRFVTTYKYEDTQYKSTKIIEIKGTFVAKAGFKINDEFVIDVAPDAKSLVVHHGNPVLLSCEQVNVEIIAHDSGWWNFISKEDQAVALNRLLQQARGQAMDADLKRTATHNLLQRLEPLTQAKGIEVTGQISPPLF